MEYVRKWTSFGGGRDTDEAVEIHVSEDVQHQVTSILSYQHRNRQHPYGKFAGSERSELEAIHGRDPKRRVRIMLPTSHVEHHQKRMNSVSRQRRKPDTSTIDLLRIYQSACHSRKCPPIPAITDQLTIESLCQVIASNPTLREIDFSGLELFKIVFELRDHFVCESRTYLDMKYTGAGLDDAAIHLLVQHILLRRCCSKLNLGENPFGLQGMNAVCELLQRSIVLSYLNLSGITLTRKMGMQLQHSLPRTKLHTLILHQCGLD
eukprot:gene6004-9129_t